MLHAMEAEECEDLSCNLCGVHPTSHEDLEAHLRGRSHMIMAQRSEVAERSVYVRGFSYSQSAERELRELMGQFGGVVSVAVVAGDSDVYGIVEFGAVDAALRALRQPLPLTLHTHTLTIKPRLLKHGKVPKITVMQGRRKCLDVAMATRAPVVGGANEEEIVVGGVKLPPEAVAKLSAVQSVELQLETLASHCCLGNGAIEEQLSLAWRLQAKLRSILPHCAVVPFGATLSGHGTVSSDCDLCLLTGPHPLDHTLFLGSAYLPSHFHSFWDKLQATPNASAPSLVAPHYPALTSAAGARRGSNPVLEEVLALLVADKTYTGVRALKFARVPVIKFTSGQLHCDLSFDNRLGPANTRLLAAYMNFDPRMAVLVTCVRLWMRGWGMGRSQLINYAVSLLLIHSLQHSSPPVLPCLQKLGVWPRDMHRIGLHGLSVEPAVEIDGWNCSFCDPLSLLPSSNTASPAELLLHFFHYYSEVFSFSQHIVTIHTLTPPPIPTRDSIPGFKVSAMCVQDPFELSHNVTKSMRPANLAQLQRAMRRSHQLLTDLLHQEQSLPTSRQDILQIFKPSAQLPPPPPSTAGHSVELETAVLSRLLHNTQFSGLEERVGDLDLGNSFVCQRLNHVVLHSLTHHLQEVFGVRVQFQQQGVGAVAPGPPQRKPELLEMAPAGARKRERSVEEMEVEGGELEGAEVKRQKLEFEESADDLLLRLTERESLQSKAECVAMEDGWVGGRRRRRRQQQREAGPAPSMTSSPTTVPCLAFTVSVSTNIHSGTIVSLQTSDPKFKLPFEMFYSACKRKLFQ